MFFPRSVFPRILTGNVLVINCPHRPKNLGQVIYPVTCITIYGKVPFSGDGEKRGVEVASCICDDDWLMVVMG